MEKNKNENLPEITTGKLATDLAIGMVQMDV